MMEKMRISSKVAFSSSAPRCLLPTSENPIEFVTSAEASATNALSPGSRICLSSKPPFVEGDLESLHSEHDFSLPLPPPPSSSNAHAASVAAELLLDVSNLAGITSISSCFSPSTSLRYRSRSSSAVVYHHRHHHQEEEGGGGIEFIQSCKSSAVSTLEGGGGGGGGRRPPTTHPSASSHHQYLKKLKLKNESSSSSPPVSPTNSEYHHHRDSFRMKCETTAGGSLTSTFSSTVDSSHISNRSSEDTVVLCINNNSSSSNSHCCSGNSGSSTLRLCGGSSRMRASADDEAAVVLPMVMKEEVDDFSPNSHQDPLSGCSSGSGSSSSGAILSATTTTTNILPIHHHHRQYEDESSSSRHHPSRNCCFSPSSSQLPKQQQVPPSMKVCFDDIACMYEYQVIPSLQRMQHHSYSFFRNSSPSEDEREEVTEEAIATHADVAAAAAALGNRSSVSADVCSEEEGILHFQGRGGGVALEDGFEVVAEEFSAGCQNQVESKIPEEEKEEEVDELNNNSKEEENDNGDGEGSSNDDHVSNTGGIIFSSPMASGDSRKGRKYSFPLIIDGEDVVEEFFSFTEDVDTSDAHPSPPPPAAAAAAPIGMNRLFRRSKSLGFNHNNSNGDLRVGDPFFGSSFLASSPQWNNDIHMAAAAAAAAATAGSSSALGNSLRPPTLYPSSVFIIPPNSNDCSQCQMDFGDSTSSTSAGRPVSSLFTRSSTMNSMRGDVQKESSESGNGADPRRVRFASEDVWSFFAGKRIGASTPAAASFCSSYDPSLCYSMSMTNLESTAAATSNPAITDIYSRWEMTPMPEGCSYDASWSQAMFPASSCYARGNSNGCLGNFSFSQSSGSSPTGSTLSAGFCTPQTGLSVHPDSNGGIPEDSELFDFGFTSSNTPTHSTTPTPRHYGVPSPPPSTPSSSIRNTNQNVIGLSSCSLTPLLQQQCSNTSTSTTSNNNNSSVNFPLLWTTSSGTRPTTPHRHYYPQSFSCPGGSSASSSFRRSLSVSSSSSSSSSNCYSQVPAPAAAAAAVNAAAVVLYNSYHPQPPPQPPQQTTTHHHQHHHHHHLTHDMITTAVNNMNNKKSIHHHLQQQQHQQHPLPPPPPPSSSQSSLSSHHLPHNPSTPLIVTTATAKGAGGSNGGSSLGGFAVPQGQPPPPPGPPPPPSNQGGPFKATILPILKRNAGWGRTSRVSMTSDSSSLVKSAAAAAAAAPPPNASPPSSSSLGNKNNRTSLPGALWTPATLMGRFSIGQSWSLSSAASPPAAASGGNNHTTSTSSGFSNFARAWRSTSRTPRRNSTEKPQHHMYKPLFHIGGSGGGSGSSSKTTPQNKHSGFVKAAAAAAAASSFPISPEDSAASFDMFDGLKRDFSENKFRQPFGFVGVEEDPECHHHHLNAAVVPSGGVGSPPPPPPSHPPPPPSHPPPPPLPGKRLEGEKSSEGSLSSGSANCGSCWGSRKHRKTPRPSQYLQNLQQQQQQQPKLNRTYSKSYTTVSTQVANNSNSRVSKSTNGIFHFQDGVSSLSRNTSSQTPSSHASTVSASALKQHGSSISSAANHHESATGLEGQGGNEILREDAASSRSRSCSHVLHNHFHSVQQKLQQDGGEGGGGGGGGGGVGGGGSSPAATGVAAFSESSTTDTTTMSSQTTSILTSIPPYDLQFGTLRVKLHKKLSAKCHCQFDVWEAEATQVVEPAEALSFSDNNSSSNVIDVTNNSSASLTSLESSASPFPFITQESSPLADPNRLGEQHVGMLELGSRFALKLLEVDMCDASKLKYKTHSITAEGRQLRNLCCQLMDRERNHAKIKNEEGEKKKTTENGDGSVNLLKSFRSSGNFMPVPHYLWTANGKRQSDRQAVLGVAMEVIQGRSLTQILQQLRCPMKPSAALLALEIAIKIVESQLILAEKLPQPLINWDTKPGNIILELTRSASGRLHCCRAVIIDLGDALPGSDFWFPTRHRPGETPGYIICTKGYCSPECAVLVFLLASSSRCGGFRRVWYGENAKVEELQEARRQRLPHRWRQWVKEGYLRRTYMINQTNNYNNITSGGGTTTNMSIATTTTTAAAAAAGALTSSLSSPAVDTLTTMNPNKGKGCNSTSSSSSHIADVSDSSASVAGSFNTPSSLLKNHHHTTFKSHTTAVSPNSIASPDGCYTNTQNSTATTITSAPSSTTSNAASAVAVVSSRHPSILSSAAISSGSSRGLGGTGAIVDAAVERNRTHEKIEEIEMNQQQQSSSSCSSRIVREVPVGGGGVKENFKSSPFSSQHQQSGGVGGGGRGNSGGLTQQPISSAVCHRDRGWWEVKFSSSSVVFSTGLVLAQLFGGPNLLQVVEKDEVRALDLLCEWGSVDTPNFYLGLPNLGPANLLPSTGVFSEEPWRSRLLTLLEGCLAFLPSKRWTFEKMEKYLTNLYQDYCTFYSANKTRGLAGALHAAALKGKSVLQQTTHKSSLSEEKSKNKNSGA